MVALANLPELAKLVLMDNKLTDVVNPFPRPSSDDKPRLWEAVPAGGFASLEVLKVERNAIASWHAIDALNTLPKLTTLGFAGNPVTEELDQMMLRREVVGRMPQLLAINELDVTPEKRAELEIAYLKFALRSVGVDLHSRIPAGERWILPSDLRQFGNDEHREVLRERDPNNYGYVP